MLPRLLVTGFGPFPGAPRNPTEAVVDRLRRRADLGGRVTVIGIVLETTWAAIEAFPTLLQDVDPDAVLMLGLARRTRVVRVERTAHARCAPAVDADGRRGTPSSLSGPAPLRTTAPALSILAAIRAQGLPAEISDDAGAYLCNALYRTALEVAGGRPTAFLHLPPTRDLSPTSRYDPLDLERGVSAAIPPLLAQVTRRSA